ncbi:Rv3235 family protein [Streptomyces sp. NPDC058773]|uniref:Rv3235 family protein n=1 Tax=Streptomyces sp. NPDC058773 TaxID=3346632 RepID=UPI0036BE9D6A
MTDTDHSTADTTPTTAGNGNGNGNGNGSTARPTTIGLTTHPAASATAPTPPDATVTGRGPRARPAAGTPSTLPAVPRPRRSPVGRRPLGPAGSGPGASAPDGADGRSSTGSRSRPAGRGPGSAGRGPTRTAPRPVRPAATAAAESRRARAAAAYPIGAAGAPLPSAGARRRAHESQPHHWFAQQLVLALSGQRPVHALLGHALPAAYDRLAELAPQAPLRPAPGPGRRGAAPTVRDCGLCRPRRGVIEAFARIAAGERLRALAFRLELGADSRWRCAALDVGPAPAPACPAP